MRSQRTRRGNLVVFEGPDGVGKTTLAKAFVRQMRAAGERIDYLAFPGTERGSLGSLVYRLHHDPYSLGVTRPTHPSSLQVLHVAAHIDAIERDVHPRLAERISVVLDRFWWSTYAYGAVDGVEESTLRSMTALEDRHWRTTLPDAVFLVSRDQSPEDERVGALWHHYGRIAELEQVRYPVHHLRNEGTIEEALAQIHERLSEASPR